MPTPSDMMDTHSQYSSCETLDSHKSSETDEKNDVNGNGRPSRKVSVEHTDYVQKARITRAAPPPPAHKPMQFVAVKPCNLYQTAHEQLKKAEEIKKVKEVKKEEPEDWQNNLDNWKSSRRKRVEHIIDRVVEVKKLEFEEHDRNRRKSKTFNELMEERGSRTTRKLSSLAIYSEDNDDISDLTTGLENTSEYGECSSSSVSDKETMDNSDNNSDVDKPKDVQDKKKTEDVFNNNNHNNLHSTALIKDVIHKKPVLQSREVSVVKTEISDVMTAKVAKSIYNMSTSTTTTTTTEKTKTSNEYTYDDAIEDYKSRVSRAVNPVQQPFSTNSMAAKLDVPKVDIWKRRELFESQSDSSNSNNISGNSKMGGEITSIKDRISSLKSNLVTQAAPMAPRKVEVPTSTKLKDRLSSLQSSVTVEEQQKRPIEMQFRNVQEVKNEFEQQNVMKAPAGLMLADDNESLDTDREDSGIHTTDVSCSVSQADQFDEQHIDEFPIVEERVLKLNAAAKVLATKECNVVQPMAAAQIYEESIDMDQIDDESSVIEEALDLAFEIMDNEIIENVPTMNGLQSTVNRQQQQQQQHEQQESILKSSFPLSEPIYENVEEALMEEKIEFDNAINVQQTTIDDEPHYQVPKSREPYYEVPKKHLPIPLYENVELMFVASSDSSRYSMAESNESFGVDDGNEMIFPIDQSKYLIMEPPKEKPPPPPLPLDDDSMMILQQHHHMDESQTIVDNNFKRINSTKRIKKEIRNKRSSFLGIEGQDFDDYSLQLSIAPPPDMQALLQEEKRLEKEMYQKVGLYENSDNGESRDSGLSDNHSRQSSEPSSTSSDEQTMGSSGMLMSEQRGNYKNNGSYTVNKEYTTSSGSYTVNSDDSRIKSLEDQIREQETYGNYRQSHHHNQDDYQKDYFDDESEEVLRVERELLQLEQEELKRQRENLIMRKNMARKELDEGVKMIMNNPNRLSLQDLNAPMNGNGCGHYENLQQQQQQHHQQHQHQQQQQQQQHKFHQHHQQQLQAPFSQTDYRKSMPNLQNLQEFGNAYQQHQQSSIYPPPPPPPPTSYQYPNDNIVNILLPKPYQAPQHLSNSNSSLYNNMSRNDLMAISAVPKPKLTNDWIQYRKTEPVKQSLNSHWLIQEAEQRRIEQMNNVRTNSNSNSNNSTKKPLPDSIIQTLTQRVQSMGIGEKKRQQSFDPKQISQQQQIQQPPPMAPLLMLSQKTQPSSATAMAITNNGTNNLMHNPMTMKSSMMPPPPPPPTTMSILENNQLLSVSSKKKCSYCSRELGSGAAMIIENLGLFYHIDCFKCSVCHVNISDGNLNGTDVRVRNNRLHCHNCFSNEDGIKFSCV